MEEFEGQEIQVKSEDNKESQFGEREVPNNFDDFEEFTDFTRGGGLETTTEEGRSRNNDDFDDFADFTESSDAFDTSENFQGHSNNNSSEQISNVSLETKLVSMLFD